MQKNEFNEKLLAFLAESPTPFHAVNAMANHLQAGGFEELREANPWSLRTGGRYFCRRNDSSIVAFILGDDPIDRGVRMMGAHTDSPCLKVKPNAEVHRNGYFQLGVEIYGGVLLNPWFDRDLSLAGRVSYANSDGAVESCLIDFVEPIATVPNLAIHLDREANNNRTVNAQNHMPPVLAVEADDDKTDFKALLTEQIKKEHPDRDVLHVLDFELSFYDTQAPAMIGLNRDFIASARLDNLLSCFVGMQSMIDAGEDQTVLLVCNDHEEVGSMSSSGAQGPMLKSVLERLCDNAEDVSRMIDRSMMISADNAHGIHPNYADKHDGKHGPILNQGPVVKTNANQRYASNSETSALFRQLCLEQEVPMQSFVVRSDMACGSTIGPITASELGVRTLDVGVPTFAMHSIRELAGSEDAFSLYCVFNAYLQRVHML